MSDGTRLSPVAGPRAARAVVRFTLPLVLLLRLLLMIFYLFCLFIFIVTVIFFIVTVIVFTIMGLEMKPRWRARRWAKPWAASGDGRHVVRTHRPRRVPQPTATPGRVGVPTT